MPLVIIGLPLALLALLAWTSAAGLQQTYSQTFGAMIRWFADVAGKFSIGGIGPFKGVKPFGFLKNALDSFDHTIQAAIGHVAAHNGAKVAKYLLNVALLWSGVGYVFEKFAFATLHALHDLRHSALPKAVSGRAKPLQGQVNKVGKMNTAVAGRELPALRRGLRTVEHEERALARRVGALAAAVAGALALPGAGALDWPRPNTGTRPRADTGTRSRLGRLERILIGAGVAALIWTGIRRLGLRWLRCYKVNKVGKAVCGMDPQLLDSLLLDTLLIVGTLSIREFASDMEFVAGELADATNVFWRGDKPFTPVTPKPPSGAPATV